MVYDQPLFKEAVIKIYVNQSGYIANSNRDAMLDFPAEEYAMTRLILPEDKPRYLMGVGTQ
jgi:hypothetical protein